MCSNCCRKLLIQKDVYDPMSKDKWKFFVVQTLQRCSWWFAFQIIVEYWKTTNFHEIILTDYTWNFYYLCQVVAVSYRIIQHISLSSLNTINIFETPVQWLLNNNQRDYCVSICKGLRWHQIHLQNHNCLLYTSRCV